MVLEIVNLVLRQRQPHRAIRLNQRRHSAAKNIILVDHAIAESTDKPTVVRRRIDLWPLVESLIQDLQPISMTDHTRLINEVAEEFIAYADTPLLRRVLQNLVANAMQHAPRGEVRIGATVLAGVGFECWVQDNGLGISPERLDKVWDKFETDSPNGHGLGLAIVKTYIEAHGGSVAVESTEGAGTCFRIRIPE